mmetsp:Transcript_11539/g.17457  ORF Transcript_11539/g.17457 Transcript_11539/m.17457 type:complete len:372 (-) Transcript_11539:1438-2553(-)
MATPSSISLNSNPQPLLPLSQSSIAVGSTWMLSSMLFTTYYSTAFLKYKSQKSKDDFVNRQFMSRMRREVTPVRISDRERRINVLSKYYTRPQLLTIYRLSGSFLLGIFANPQFLRWRERLMQSCGVMKDFALPAIFMFFANYCNVLALDRLGISLTYTSKCGIPILTVLITILVDGIDAIPSFLTLCSLMSIAVGIAMASWNSPTFELIGFLSAVVSATSQASLNVSCKRALTRTKISGLQAQTTMAALAFCVAIIGTTISSMLKRLSDINKKIGQDVNQNNSLEDLPPPHLTFGAVASYHVEYVLSFLFLSLVKPITYGTCDAIRRLGIIISGRRMFGGEKFSMINFFGIGLALLGALCYSILSSISKS